MIYSTIAHGLYSKQNDTFYTCRMKSGFIPWELRKEKACKLVKDYLASLIGIASITDQEPFWHSFASLCLKIRCEKLSRKCAKLMPPSRILR